MKRSQKNRVCLSIEALEDRSVPSAVAYGDFNNDGRMDMAAITAPTTVTVSLAHRDGSYTVSATLMVPKTRPMQDVYLSDGDGDGNLDIYAISPSNGGAYTHIWHGNGDGTFDFVTTVKSRHWPPPGGWGSW